MASAPGEGDEGGHWWPLSLSLSLTARGYFLQLESLDSCDGRRRQLTQIEYVKSGSVHAMHAAAAICLGRRGAGGTDASLGLPSCLPLKTMTRDQTTTAAPVHAGRDDAIRGAGRAGRRQLSRGFGAAGLEVERGPQLSLFECLDVLNLDAVLSQAFPPLTPSLPPVEKHRGVLEWGVKRARASARRPGA